MSAPLLATFVRSGAPAKLVPFGLQSMLLERIFEHLFRDAFQRGELAFLQRRWARIRMLDAGFVWSVSCGVRGLVIARDQFVADVEFAGRLEDFLLLAARRVDPDTLFFQRRIQVTGDTDLGVGCKNLLDSIDEALMPRALRRLLAFAADRIESQQVSKKIRR